MSNTQSGKRPLATCLSIIANYHQLPFSFDAATAGLAQQDGDLTPSSLATSAKRFQLSAKVYERSLKNINKNLLPVILLLKDSKACVLTSVNDDTAVIVEPELEHGETTLKLDDLEQQYSGTLFYVRPEFNMDKRADDTIKRKNGHWFWSAIKENRGTYRSVILASLLINSFALAMPVFVMNVYDRVVPNEAFSSLFALATGIFLVLTIELVLKIMRVWFIDLAANRADVKISSNIMQRVLGMKMKDKPQASGSFVSNVQSFESIRGFIGSLSVVTMVDIPFVLLFLLVVSLINIYLAIPVLIAAILVLLYSLFSQAKLKELSEHGMQAGAVRNANVYESLSSLETIKSFNAQHRVQNQWEKSTIFISRNAARMRLLASSITNTASWMQQLASISVIVIGVYLISEQMISQGALIAAYLLSARALSPVSQAAGLLSQYHHSSTAMESLENIMDRDTERYDDASTVSKARIDGHIEFKNVGFRYPDVDTEVLSHVNLSIKAGEKVAILGRNGSGKSTLARLILGLYQPERGHVLIDNVDINQLNPNLVRRHIAYVPQEPGLLFGTLRDNILLASVTRDDNDLVKVTNEMGLSALVKEHPDGFNMQVGERGGNLSGGQRQSVALARALVNDPSVLLLDEPTGMLDHASEAKIKAHLKQVTADKTLLMVTHKMTMLELVDRVVVMDSGKIVADGPKAQVLEALKQGRVGGSQRD
ncbi:type I secretion system permease/ATPase [Idiomarina sp. PL1-037]|uniref:type I secretion system permease/ATPase n=1 Tax=Idiomarina sp. PL1-037 TaxID=3095365 RepID=UPI002ACC181F|nr:type I secretion system permease/ATPase [Idiomarina sp. PL1-037]WQC53578.1 type I secretion system permease/ATPase [Idiomarina sp. PL1-037]